MPILITFDTLLARRGMTGKELARRVGLSATRPSLFRLGKVRGLRLATLSRMCATLGCTPGELLAYRFEQADLIAADQDCAPSKAYKAAHHRRRRAQRLADR